MNEIERREGFIGRVDVPPEMIQSRQTFNTNTRVGHHYPPEPGIGRVVRFVIRHDESGRRYDYAAVHAGDGKWYLTGGETKQGVDWVTMLDAIRPKLVGQLVVLTDQAGVHL